MKTTKYLNIFKIANINLTEGNIICSLLSEPTLDRLTKMGLDRRVIKPIIQKAKLMQGGINDENINRLLNDQNFISSLIYQYCR